MTINNPDFAWYLKRSKELNLTPRCPIASSELCPRYFATLSLLGREGITTDLTPEVHARLEKKWKPFEPTIAEEDVGITRAEGQQGVHAGGPSTPEPDTRRPAAAHWARAATVPCGVGRVLSCCPSPVDGQRAGLLGAAAPALLRVEAMGTA
jgi:hypothetical protein